MKNSSRYKQGKILGTRIDYVTRNETLAILEEKINYGDSKSPFHLVTAYSEFFVRARQDGEFRGVLQKADLVVPDGVGPLAAIYYNEIIKNDDSLMVKAFKGLFTGARVLRGHIGQPVSGIWLFAKLTNIASKNDWGIFLLGGFGNTSERLAQQLREKYPKIIVQSDMGTDDYDILNWDCDRVIEKINKFAPEILFVAFGPIKQEKWISKYKSRLKAKIIIGVGGTFDEELEIVSKTPSFVESIGLKWLWRFVVQPKRFKRTLNAFPVFPLLVFREALGRN